MTPIRRARALLLGVLLLLASSAWAADPTTVLLVRHAEKAASPADDPPLTRAGKERALALREMVRGAGVDVILATDRIRTQQTVSPAAKLLGIEPEILAMDDVDSMATAIHQLEGKTVLVGSHSGDSIELIEKLGAGKLEPIEEHQYDDFFVITVDGPGDAHVIRLKYGTPTP